jgi:DNA-binding transcriptional regulator YiaG
MSTQNATRGGRQVLAAIDQSVRAAAVGSEAGSPRPLAFSMAQPLVLSDADLLAGARVCLDPSDPAVIPVAKAHQIREIRNMAGLSLAQMALVLGVSGVRVDKLELGMYPPTRLECQTLELLRRTLALMPVGRERNAWGRALAELAQRRGPHAAIVQLAGYADKWT